MSDFNVICPQCGEENAYFDGAEYYCPDCDYSWDADVEFDESDDDDDD